MKLKTIFHRVCHSKMPLLRSLGCGSVYFTWFSPMKYGFALKSMISFHRASTTCYKNDILPGLSGNNPHMMNCPIARQSIKYYIFHEIKKYFARDLNITFELANIYPLAHENKSISMGVPSLCSCFSTPTQTLKSNIKPNPMHHNSWMTAIG